MSHDNDASESPKALADSVEADFQRLKGMLAIGWRKDPTHVQALIDRLTVEGLLESASRPKRRVYQAIAEYLEESLEERQDADPLEERRRAGRRGYLKRLLAGFDPQG